MNRLMWTRPDFGRAHRPLLSVGPTARPTRCRSALSRPLAASVAASVRP